MDWPNDAKHWPSYMRSIVERHGGDSLYRVGLGVLGFPPTWNPSRNQIAAIIEVIESEDFNR